MRRHRAPLGLAVLVLVLGLPALSRYGVTWDEALGDFFFGERYLDFFRSLDPRHLDFAADPYPPGHVPDLSVSPFRDRPWEYYPVANLLAAATSRLTSGALGWLDPFDGFHALNLLLGAVLAAALYSFVRRRFDAPAALGAVVLLFTSPRIVAHLLSNVKDVPEMVFFALTLLAFAAAYERGSAPGIVGAGALWGLALGTKANALFLPAIALAAILAAPRSERWRGRSGLLVAALAAAAGLGLALLLVSWPYLWAAPLDRAREHLEYIGLRLFATRPESILSPLAALVTTTPLPFLALSAAGTAIALRELLVERRAQARTAIGGGSDRDPEARAAAVAPVLRHSLPLAWIAVVLVRLHLPGAVNFDGVRHFLELFPALAMVAGVALSRAASAVAAAPIPARRAAAAALLVAALAPGAIAVARYHPFELAYWNALAGGLDGARARGLAQAGDYWATGYRTGLRWLNAHAPPGAALAVPLAQHTVGLVAPLRLRGDIGLLDLARPEVPELRPDVFAVLERVARERPVYVMFALREDWSNRLIEDCLERLRPLVRWEVDGEPVLLVYRWSPPPAAES